MSKIDQKIIEHLIHHKLESDLFGNLIRWFEDGSDFDYIIESDMDNSEEMANDECASKYFNATYLEVKEFIADHFEYGGEVGEDSGTSSIQEINRKFTHQFYTEDGDGKTHRLIFTDLPNVTDFIED